jgi:drug/metabolite transporter (DMT)-like permease
MTRRGLILFAAMSVIWGIPYLFIRIAVDEITPAVLVFGRTALATALLLPFALMRIDLRPVVARWRWVVAFAVIEIAIPWVLLATAEQRLSSSLTGLLIAATPLAGVVIAYVTGGDRLGRTALFGLLLGLVGVIAIVGADFRVDDVGSFLALGGVAFCYALGPAILARRLGGLPSLGIMALSLAGTALLYAPVAAAQWPATTPSSQVLLSVLVLGTVCTAAAFLVFAALIEEIGPIRATVITYINPAVAAVLGVVVLGESFTIGMAIGFALVIAGSAISTRRPATPVPATEPRPDSSTEPRLGPA